MVSCSCVKRILKLKTNIIHAYTRQYSILQKGKDVVLEALKGADEGIFTLAINRPEVKNAVSRNIITEISSLLDKLAYDKTLRVLIFRSLTPGAFCAGADLKERITLTPSEVYQMSIKFRSLTNQLEALPVPTIAAIDGVALGGGLEIALACDLRIAVANAKLGLVETKLAIMPGAGGTQRLPRIAGSSVAKELIFTGRIVSGQEAYSLGIVNHVVEQDKGSFAAYDKSLEIGREIVPNGPIGVKMAKSAINRGLQVDLYSGCAIEDSCYAQIIPTKDRLEGLKAFNEKRKPHYTGE